MAVTNSCSCSPPVGGGGACSPSQLAICRNDGTHCFHECRDSTSAAALSDEAFQQWAFEAVTGQRLTRPLTDIEQRILASGKYWDAARKHEVTFTMPERDGEQQMSESWAK